MLKLTTLLLIYLWTARVGALNLETHFYRAFTSAKTPQQITAATKDYERWKVTHAACLIELRERKLPSSCYEELQWMRASPSKRAHFISRLDQLCTQVARRLDTPLVAHPSLSKPCAKEVKEAIATQAYRSEDADERWSEN